MVAVRTSSTRRRLSRRAFLRGVGASAAFLPLLHVDPVRAAGGSPRRVITLTWTNGVAASAFWPAGDNPVDSEILRPLQPLASKVLGPIGLDLKVMLDNGRKYDGHRTYAALFSGTHVYSDGRHHATGPSLDQAVSDAFARQVNLPIPLLNVAPVAGSAAFVSTSCNGKGVRNTPESEPVRLFNTAFASQSQPMDRLVALRERRKSVIDFLNKDLQAFATRLGTEDRAKIEAHLHAVRQLEVQLSSDAGRSCRMATAPAAGKDYPTQVKGFLDLVALAIRCDLTRAVSIVLGANYGGPPYSFPFLGVNGDYHGIAHQGTAAYPAKIKIDTWYVSQVAYLAKLLDATTEAGGTALDNSVMVVAPDMNEGSNHYVGQIPFLLIGSAGGYFKTGRTLKLGTWAGKTGAYWKTDSGVPHNKLLASVCNAVGIPVQGFGKYTGTLPELRG